jgi:hypothetical protein
VRAVCMSCVWPVGTTVDQVVSGSGSSPAVVKLAGGRSISASKGVVVAVEGPAAAQLLGQALQVCHWSGWHGLLHAHKGVKLLAWLWADLQQQSCCNRRGRCGRGGSAGGSAGLLHAHGGMKPAVAGGGTCSSKSAGYRRCRCIIPNPMSHVRLLMGWS